MPAHSNSCLFGRYVLVSIKQLLCTLSTARQPRAHKWKAIEFCTKTKHSFSGYIKI